MNQPAVSTGTPAKPVAGAGAPAPASAPGGHPALLSAARLVSFAVICGLLYWGRAVAVPFALAVLFSFMLNPVVRRLQRKGVPGPVAAGATMVLACAAVATLTWVIGQQIYSLGHELPSYQKNITTKLREARKLWKGGAMEKIQTMLDNVAEEWDRENVPNAEDGRPAAPDGGEKPQPVYIARPQKVVEFSALSSLQPFVDPVVTAGLVILLVTLLLLRWEDMRSRLISFSGHRKLTVATKACDDAGRRIARYLLMQFAVNASYGATMGIGLYFLGVPYAALWALCAALFRYVPYAGPTVAALLPILFSFITSDGWGQPLRVTGFILCLEIVSNNFVEPWLYGSQLGLSAMGVVMSAVAWTFLWGPVGLVMATPLTVCLVVLGEYVPAFAIFTRLLGDKPVMEPQFRFYQRLLAHDETEAAALAREHVKEHGLRESVDRLFVPAVALARRDDAAGLLDPEDGVYVPEAAERIFQLAREEAAVAEEEPAEPPKHTANVIVWPFNEFAAVAARMLEWCLRDTAAAVTVLSPRMLLGEGAEHIRTEHPAAVCLLNLAGPDAARTRSFARRLRAIVPNVPLVIARPGAVGAIPATAREATRDTETGTIVRSVDEAAAALLPLAASPVQ